MVGGVCAAAGISELWRLLQASKKNAGKSTDKIFSSPDTGGDDSINKSELSSALSSSSPRGPVPGSGGDSTSALVNLLEALTQAVTGATGPGGTDPAGRLSAEGIFKKTDANGDGSLDKTEFENGRPHDMTVAQADELYSRLDANSDNAISESEFTANRPGRHNGPPPPPDSTGGTDGSTNSSSSDVLSAASALMQAIEKYVQYGQSAAATVASSGLLAVTV